MIYICSIARKASLTTQIMKYQRQLQTHKEAVDDWKRKSEEFLMTGGVMEKLPLFPQIDIEKFTPEVTNVSVFSTNVWVVPYNVCDCDITVLSSPCIYLKVPVRGPLRHPSQPSASDFKLAANFTGQPIISAAPPYHTTTGMEAAGRSVPLGGLNQSRVSPVSTFTPNRKSDRPGTGVIFEDKSTCNQKYAASVSELHKGNLIENMGLGHCLKGSQLALGITDETMEADATQRKSKLFPPNKTSQTLQSQDSDTQSTTPEKMPDAKSDAILGRTDTHGQNQVGSTPPSSVDSAIIDFKLDEMDPYQTSTADTYMYMQQVYASQYEYTVDPYFWFGAPLGLYNGQFPVPPVPSYESLLPENYQSCDKEQMNNKQGGDHRPGEKSCSDISGNASPIDLVASDGQVPLSQSTPSISPDGSPSESKTNQENKASILPGKRGQCNLPDEMKYSIDVAYATSNTQGAAGDVNGSMKATSYTATSPLGLEPVQQEATNRPSRQNLTDSCPFIFGLPSSSESEVNHIKGEMAKNAIHKLSPGAHSLVAESQVPDKSLNLEPTSFVQKNDAKQIFTDPVTSPQFQKVSIDKTTICHPNQVKSGKRTAAPCLQANLGLDDFDSLSIRSPKKKRVRGNQKEEMKRTGSGEITAEDKESQGSWIHMVGKKKKRSQEQVSQKKQQEPLVSSHPGEDEHIPNYFSLTHLLRKLSEMFPDESRSVDVWF
ncbi:hypothetical protein HOLleu_20288 [Holothuria leucospilota]|uniref:Uncharacterized protein n=1 Tax=Holothuria leucospilota TaxID=206669 RepID=A0A9Q1C1B4_HOLLE|nr:hypothetical protein HOLleu_20288 [Holothuria leucospilota]